MGLEDLFGGNFSKKRKQELYLGNIPKSAYLGFAPKDPSTIHDVRVPKSMSGGRLYGMGGMSQGVGGPRTYEELVEDFMQVSRSRREAEALAERWMQDNGYAVVDGDIVQAR